MDAQILFNITNLSFEGQGILSGNFFNLSNIDRGREIFYTDVFKKELGEFETRYTPNSVYGFCNLILENTANKSKTEIANDFKNVLFEREQALLGYLTFTWLVKDNSIGILSSVGYINNVGISKIISSVKPWDSKGEQQYTVFTKEELVQVADYTVKYQEIMNDSFTPINDGVAEYHKDQEGKQFRNVVSRLSPDFNYNNQNAIQRALKFLAAARENRYLVYKIAYYMPVFECLFITDAAEITTKMAYRAAFYIGENLEECKSIFKTVTDGYNIRSRYLHGQKFSSDSEITNEKLVVLSTKIDDILRRIFVKIINGDYEPFISFSKEERNKFLNGLVFDSRFRQKDLDNY
jgi:hypothetical protein